MHLLESKADLSKGMGYGRGNGTLCALVSALDVRGRHGVLMETRTSVNTAGPDAKVKRCFICRPAERSTCCGRQQAGAQYTTALPVPLAPSRCVGGPRCHTWHRA